MKRIQRSIKTVTIGCLITAGMLFGSPSARGTPTDAPPENRCIELLKSTYPKLQDESPQSLCQYSGQVVLVVNTASYCGFTHQYDGLERLYERFKGQGFVVLGFPSNDFGQQEPGSNKKIADFCQNTYGIRFPMFAKSHVRGPNANPLFQELGKITGETPSWNFHKYLISRDGRQVLSFGSQIAPESKALTGAIEKMLSPQTASAVGRMKPQGVF